MNQYTYLLQWKHCPHLEDVNEAILTRDEKWIGLTSAEQIVSITWVERLDCYCVVWKVREWLGGEG
jgi:hypothetical protein